MVFEKATIARIREIGEFLIKLSRIGIKEERIWRLTLARQLRERAEFLEKLAEWLESQ